jgi:hypothetical protein
MKYKFLQNPAPLFLIISLSITIAGCVKTGTPAVPESQYYIRFRANGELKEFRFLPMGRFNTYSASSGFYDTFVSSSINLSNRGKIMIMLSNTSVLQTGLTAVNYLPSQPGFIKVWFVTVYYFDENETLFTSIKENNPSGGAEPNTAVTVTDVSNGSMRGKFESTVYISSNSEKIKITDGEFYVSTK